MASTPADSDVELDLPFLAFRRFKDGRVERLKGEDVLPPSNPDPTTLVSSIDVILTTHVSARLYIPHHILTNENKKKLPILVYYHGGAFILESPFSRLYQPYLNSLVSKSEIVAVSVHYRRATEHPLPIAYNDSWAALQWVASHANSTGPNAWLNDYADFTRLFLSGDSAGANIVHNLAMRPGKEPLGGGVELDGIVLVHPYFWGEERLESEVAMDKNVIKQISLIWRVICPSAEKGNDDPWINPVSEGAPDLAALGCKRVLVCLAEKDLLMGRGKVYCEALQKSGWGGTVEVLESEGEPHVFHLFNPDCDNAVAMMKQVVAFFVGKKN